MTQGVLVDGKVVQADVKHGVWPHQQFKAGKRGEDD